MNRKNTNLNRELALGALTISLCIIFLGLSYVVPFISFFGVVFIPFLTALFAFRASPKAQVIFACSLLLISFIDIQEGVFFLFPNSMIGLLYGNLIKKKLDHSTLFMVTAVVTFLVSYGLIYPINFVFKTDVFLAFAKLFGLELDKFMVIAPSFFFLISFVQTTIMHLSIMEELKKFKMEMINWKYQFQLNTIVNFVLLSCMVGFSFLNLSVAYLLLSITLIYSCFNAFTILFYKSNVTRTIYGLCLLVSIFIAIALLSVLKQEHYALTLGLFSLVTILFSTVFCISYRLIKHQSFTNLIVTVEDEEEKSLI